MAMNDNQFNKAEIWRYFGEGKAPIESDDRGEPSNVNAIRVEDEEYLNTEIQAYSQFDFFDELSYTFEPGTNSGRDLISEQVKVNTETPGDFPRHPSNRGGHLGFHGGNGGREPSNRGDSRGFRGGNDGSFVWHPVQ